MNSRILKIILLGVVATCSLKLEASIPDSIHKRIMAVKGVDLIDTINALSELYRDENRLLSYELSKFALNDLNIYKNLNGKAQALKNIGNIQFFLAKQDSARYFYRKANNIYTELKNASGMAACANNIGLSFQEEGTYDSATKYYNKAYDIYVKSKDASGQASSIMSIAEVLIMTGKTKDAMKLMQNALEIFEKEKDLDGIMGVLNNRSSIWAMVENYDKAIEDIDKYIKLSHKANNKYNIVLGYGNKGAYLYNLGKLLEAEQVIDSALYYGDEAEDGHNLYNIYLTLSAIYTDKHEFSKSNVLLQKALKHFVNTGNKRKLSRTLHAIGYNLFLSKEYENSKNYCVQSYHVAKEIEAESDIPDILYSIMSAYTAMGDINSADSINEIYKQTLLNSTNQSDEELLSLYIKPQKKEYKTALIISNAVLLCIVGFLLISRKKLRKTYQNQSK